MSVSRRRTASAAAVCAAGFFGWAGVAHAATLIVNRFDDALPSIGSLADCTGLPQSSCSLRQAVALANDTIYGLSGSVWTRDGAKALRTARAIETGVISINSNTSVRVATPFGGFKQSGVGRELGPHALEHYSEVKSVYYATES